MVTEFETTQLEPYVGPVPFEAKDQALFFGRESESDELLSLAIAHPVVLMYAQSGAGKTSLLNANFVPKLKKEGYEVWPTARVQGTECDARTNIYVYNTLMNWAEGKLDSRQARMTLADFLKDRVHQKNNVDWELPRFLIFDQFEELFTAYPQRWQERREFFIQIRDALEKDYLLRVVFAMREDYIAELDAYASLLPEKLRTRFRLERPREKAALAAVKKPLTVVKTRRHFEEGVAEKLVQNLLMIPAETSERESSLGQFIEPVQLQVVCQSLWKALRPEDDAITYEHLESCGDVNQALSDFYERCINRAVNVTGIKEGPLRDWFGSTLITSDNTRGMVFRGADKTGLIPNSAIDVLEKLHLIKEEKRGRGRWYELAHDRFIDPIRKSNEKWLSARAGAVETRQRLETRAKEWVRQGRGSEGLLDEAELLEADRWRTSPDAADLPPSETALALMSASRTAIKEEKEAARQVQMLALEQARRFRQQRVGLVAMAVLLMVMSALTVYAFRQRAIAKGALEEARKQRTEAVTQRDAADMATKEAVRLRTIAEGAKIDADNQRAEAQKQRTQAVAEAAQAQRAEATAKRAEANALAQKLVAEMQRNTVEAEELSAKAGDQLNLNSDFSVLLAREAVKKTYDVDRTVIKPAAEALHQAVQAVRERRIVSFSHDRSILNSVAFSPDGTRMAGISSNGSIKIWDIIHGEPLYSLPNAGGRPQMLAFSADGNFLVSGSTDGKILLWDVEAQRMLDQTSAGFYPTKLAFTRKTGTGATVRLVGSGYERSGRATSNKAAVFLWEIVQPEGRPSERKFLPVDVPRDAYKGPLVETVAIDPDGKILAFGRPDGSTFFWDVEKRTAILKPGIHMDDSSPVTLLAFNSDGKRFAAATTDGAVKVWTFASGVELFRSCNSLRGDRPLAFSSDLEYFATTGSGTTARVQRLRQPAVHEESPTVVKPEELKLDGHKGAVLDAAFSAYGKSLITTSEDGTAIVWEVSFGREWATLSGPWTEVAGIKFTPDGQHVLGAIADDSHPTAEVWDISNESNTTSSLSLRAEDPRETRNIGKCGSSLRDKDKCGHRAKVWAVDFYEDTSNNARSRIATGSADRTAKIWDPKSGNLLQTLYGHKGTVREIAFSPTGDRLATGSDDGTAKIWDLASGAVILTLNVNEAARQDSALVPKPWLESLDSIAITGVAFSPDGKSLATTNLDGIVRVWNLAACKVSPSCKPTLALRGHEGVVWKVAFSPHGDRIATASWDKTAKVWDAATGQELFTLKGHTDQLWGISFSRDGKRIATASSDLTARIWDSASGRELLVLTGHSATVNRAVFSPDGSRLATSSEDGTVRSYLLDIKDLIALSEKRVPGQLMIDAQGNYVRKPEPK